MAKKKFTKEDLEKKMKAGTLPALQSSLFGVDTDVQTNDLPSDSEYTTLVEMMHREEAFFFPLNVPSLKNSQEIQQMYTGLSACCNAPYIKHAPKVYSCTKCQQSCKLGTRHRLAMSKNAQDYMNTVIPFFEAKFNKFEKIINTIGYPVHMGMYFIRESKHEFDFDNAITMICDVIKKRIIKDDSMLYFYGYSLGWHHDKDNPGVIITFIHKPKYDYYHIEQKQKVVEIPDI